MKCEGDPRVAVCVSGCGQGLRLVSAFLADSGDLSGHERLAQIKNKLFFFGFGAGKAAVTILRTREGKWPILRGTGLAIGHPAESPRVGWIGGNAFRHLGGGARAKISGAFRGQRSGYCARKS